MLADTGPTWVCAGPWPQRDALWTVIGEHTLADEDTLINGLLAECTPSADSAAAIAGRSREWIERVRERRGLRSPLDEFLQTYDLSSEEGVLLMCMAEALLRIPDAATAERMIADTLATADWSRHLGRSDSWLVNASTWGLMLTGRLVRLAPDTSRDPRAALERLAGRSGNAVIRKAIGQAMRLMAGQFVMGRTIGEARQRARAASADGLLCSYDMLGEAALTAADVERHFRGYQQAIEALGDDAASGASVHLDRRPEISVKLSALHPRYLPAQRERVLAELLPRLRRLAAMARSACVGLTVDAEEADRLELSLEIFAALLADPGLSDWDGLGLAVQAVQKRAPFVVDWLVWMARERGRRIRVRLVKGAYWDTEIKRAQQLGYDDYPVWTRKANTDVAFLACAARLLAARDAIYPMLGTHNAQNIAALCQVAMATPGGLAGFEFQRLHGMGELLYTVVAEDLPVPCRIYAPVGAHAELLPYLVRRLLENGANTSFVNRIFDARLPAAQLAADPLAEVAARAGKRNPALPLPADLYGPARRNARGICLADERVRWALADALQAVSPPDCASPMLAADPTGPADSSGLQPAQAVFDPADCRRRVGSWVPSHVDDCGAAIGTAVSGLEAWRGCSVEARAGMLEDAAERLEQQTATFVWLLVREAGKTLVDALDEVREAVDLLRYYAAEGRRLLTAPRVMPGPVGEHNELQLRPRGVFVCIAPWNFPLAIFCGQIAAALVCGNAVVAKPAEQTNLVAVRIAGLLRAAGVPAAALQVLLGGGEIGAALVADPRVAGVAFTGSVEVARSIQRTLAAREAPTVAPIPTLIAETGGQNAMIADASALPEQLVADVLHSAFGSAGQRCSALRMLYLQDEIAEPVLDRLAGAMRELVIGDPGLLATDIGPLIDRTAVARLESHATAIGASGRVIQRLALPASCAHGSYFAPMAVEIGGIGALDAEHFGPILHVARYHADHLDAVVDAINATGYGLTLGVHSRIESTWRRVQDRARAGNCYVNRGMTGAVVGVQPFGGEGLSGTGPKAGGPHYLMRFVTERTLSINTAAVGGNAALFAHGD